MVHAMAKGTSGAKYVKFSWYMTGSGVPAVCVG